VTLLPDRGERYLDSVYDDSWLARIAASRTHVAGAASPGPSQHSSLEEVL
jgi:cysteine synthase A